MRIAIFLAAAAIAWIPGATIAQTATSKPAFALPTESVTITSL